MSFDRRRPNNDDYDRRRSNNDDYDRRRSNDDYDRRSSGRRHRSDDRYDDRPRSSYDRGNGRDGASYDRPSSSRASYDRPSSSYDRRRSDDRNSRGEYDRPRSGRSFDRARSTAGRPASSFAEPDRIPEGDEQRVGQEEEEEEHDPYAFDSGYVSGVARFADGDCAMLPKLNLFIYFAACVMGAIALATQTWIEEPLAERTWGLEEFTQNQTVFKYNTNLQYFNSDERDVADAALGLGAFGVAAGGLGFLVATALYLDYGDTLEKIQPLLYYGFPFLGAFFVMGAAVHMATVFPTSDSYARMGYSHSLAVSSCFFMFLAGGLTWAQRYAVDTYFVYTNPAPRLYILITFCCLVALTTCMGLPEWVIDDTTQVHFGLKCAEWSNIRVSLSEFPPSELPSSNFTQASDAMLALGILATLCGCCDLTAGIFVVFKKELPDDSKYVFIQPICTFFAGILCLIGVIVYGALFPEVPGYSFAGSYITTVIVSVIWIISAVVHLYNAVGKENLQVVHKKFQGLLGGYVLIFVFVLVAISTRYWSTWDALHSKNIYNGINFGLNKAENGDVVYLLSDLPRRFRGDLGDMELASFLALGFGSMSIFLLLIVIGANVFKMIGKQEVVAQIVLMSASFLSCCSLFLTVTLYGALTPKTLLSGTLERCWGYSFIMAATMLCIHIVFTVVTFYFSSGEEVVTMLKQLMYPRAVASCVVNVVSMLFGVIGMTTRYWKLYDRTTFHLGLFSGNFFFQPLTLGDYTALGPDVQFATTLAIGFVSMAVLSSLLAVGAGALVARGNVDILKGKIGMIASSAAVCSTLLYLCTILFYAAWFPDPIELTFSRHDVRVYRLDFGYSFVFVCVAFVFMAISTVLLLWSTRGSEAYVHEGEFSSDMKKREKAQQMRDERLEHELQHLSGKNGVRRERQRSVSHIPKMPTHRMSSPV